MSPNTEAAQEATKLFVHQLRQRPENVVANLNCLLEGERFRLVLTDAETRIPQCPAEASLYDHLDPEGASHESGSD